MADEKPAAVVDEAAKAEAVYRSTLAKMVNEGEETTEPEKKPPSEKEDEKEGEDKPADTSTDEEGDKKEEEEPSTSDDEEGGEEGDKEAEAPEEQSKYSKAFRKLQQQEAQLQAFKTQIVTKERELQQREHQAQQAEEELRTFIRDLKVDPFEVLFRNGLINEDEAEHLAKQLYYRSRAAAADPKSRAEAERLRREQAMRMESLETKRAIARLQQEREAEKAQLASDRQLDGYVSRLEATIDAYKSKTPLLAKAWEKDPARTREQIYSLVKKLGAPTGEFPEPGAAVLEWLKERKRVLALHGYAEPAPVATDNKDKSKTAVEKKGPSNGKTTQSSKAPTTDEEKEAAYQKELRARLNGTYVGD